MLGLLVAMEVVATIVIELSEQRLRALDAGGATSLVGTTTEPRWCYGVRRSHGCIRTSLATARWLFERVAVGTPVMIQE